MCIAEYDERVSDVPSVNIQRYVYVVQHRRNKNAVNHDVLG